MSKVLYFTANPKNVEDSHSLTVGTAFINAYMESHPDDTVIRLDLFNADIAEMDKELVGLLHAGARLEDADEEHKRKYQIIQNNVNQFIEADKYVIATPLWNLGTPAIVKSYFDNVAIVGKTFKYTAEGAMGLLQGKKAVHIESCGGIYSSGPMSAFEHGAGYIKSILSFFGIQVEQIFIEGMDIQGNDVQKVQQKAIDKAVAMAKTF